MSFLTEQHRSEITLHTVSLTAVFIYVPRSSFAMLQRTVVSPESELKSLVFWFSGGSIWVKTFSPDCPLSVLNAQQLL